MSTLEFSESTREEVQSLWNLGRTAFASVWSLPPLEAYLGLRSLFGAAHEGFDEEGKTQWTFYLKAADAQIEVYDYKLASWSIGVYEKNADKPRAQRLIKALEDRIAQASRRHRNLASDLRKQPAGYIIENPFATYYETAVQLLESAEHLSADSLQTPTTTPAIDDNLTPDTLCRAAFFLFVAAVEGLLNLISELYLKLDLREDRIAERLAREQIDIKLRLIPIYCDCFPGKPLDPKAHAFQNFNRLVADRNDLIHANITKRMKQPIIYHDDRTFLLPAEKAQNRIVPGSISDIDTTRLRAVRAIVDDIVQYLVANMNPRDRNVFESVLRDEFIDVEYQDGIPVIQR